MSGRRRYAAVDLGATSGRVLAGHIDEGRVVLEEAARFANRPVRLPDGLHWNALQLFADLRDGVRAAGPVSGVGIDCWGVDYALLDRRGKVLGVPYHYRDARTAGVVDRAFARVPAAELYGVTGTQVMPINTVFQLLAERDGAALAAAERIAFMPDLFALWLSGELANEATIASTSGLLDARSGRWATGLIERLALPLRIFGDLVPEGTALGPVLGVHDLGAPTVYAVASHDTASAFAAAPLSDEHGAILSSGTWSLLGVQLRAPVVTDVARAANLTNERGIDGTTRLLTNVMGLWLLEECRRAWGLLGPLPSYEELLRLAEASPGEVPLIDPGDDVFLAPDHMPARIAAYWERTGQPAPDDRGAVVRSILVSLACKYRWALERLEAASGRAVRRVHVIGGGSRNAPLCRLTADVTRREVLAGPVEATALGNVLVQARAAGELASTSELREVAVASAAPVVFEPSGDADAGEATYRRFLDVASRERRPTQGAA